MLAYTAQKIIVLQSRSDVNILQTGLEDYYSDDLVFGGDDGVNIAFGLVDPIDPSFALDETYATIEVTVVSWDAESWYPEVITLGTHPCTRQELGLTASTKDAKFYPPNRKTRPQLEMYSQNLFCLDDKSQIKIQGNFDSANASLVYINLIGCREDQGKECKSPDEISKALTSKSLVMLSN